MLLFALSEILGKLLYLALNVANAGSFPAQLPAKEEEKLVDLAERGDEAARKKLVEHNLRLVAHITKKYYNSGADSDDLISIGTIGLIKAVSTFSRGKGIRLATYAARCIENEILMYFRFTKKSAQDVFIGDAIETDKDGNQLTFNDIISDPENIEESTELKIHLEKLGRYINSVLTPRERAVITLRYGIGGRDELTQREVADRLGISRSYVSRIEKTVLNKLRCKFEGRSGG